jgi:hypothetical protein
VAVNESDGDNTGLLVRVGAATIEIRTGFDPGLLSRSISLGI